MKKYFFRTLRIPSCCNILGTFLSKRHVWKLMLMLLLFLHSILFETVHNLSFCDNCVHLIDLWTRYLTLDNYTPLLCPFINKSDSVENSPRNRGSRVRVPAGTILVFQYHVEWILFPPKTEHFVPLNLFERCYKILRILDEHFWRKSDPSYAILKIQ